MLLLVLHPIKIAKKHNKTGAQVALAWNMTRGVSVVPKSVNDERIKQNFGAEEFRLDDEDMAEIAKIDKKLRFNNPDSWGRAFYKGLDGA